jgi:hypothetical protein
VITTIQCKYLVLFLLNISLLIIVTGYGTKYILSTSSELIDGGTMTLFSTFYAGSEVTLTANPAPGYSFLQWSGNSNSYMPLENMDMNSDKNIIA